MACVMTGGMILATLYGFQRSLRQARTMEDLPTSRIRSAAQGYVELEGRGSMMPGEPVIAPLSREPCLWWRYRISERYKDSKGRSRMRTVDSGTSDAVFLLCDGTGDCIIDPDGAQVRHSIKHTWHGTGARPATGPGHSLFGLFARYRYEEWQIKPGDPVYAIGLFQSQLRASQLDHQTALTELLREWKQNPRTLRERFDTDQDGRIDPQEWEAARQAAKKAVLSEHTEASNQPSLHILSRPGQRQPFLISAIPQKQLIRQQRINAALSLVAFLGLIGTLVWAIGLRRSLG